MDNTVAFFVHKIVKIYFAAEYNYNRMENIYNLIFVYLKYKKNPKKGIEIYCL